MTLARIALSIAAFAALAAVPAVAPAGAQQPAPPTLAINQIDAAAFPQLYLIVTALDASGVPAKGLTANQFQAFEGDTQLTIDNVQGAQDQGLRLAAVIAIDISGSMAGDPFDRAKQAATQFVNSMGPNDEAAVIAFNDTVTPVVALTTDRGKLTQGIAGLRAGGGTALYEAVQTSAFVAGSSKTARSAVIFLTDGENDTRSSTATAEGSAAAARGSRVPMFTIGFGATPDAVYLQDLAAGTQGAYRTASAGTVTSVYADIATLLRNQYIVDVRGAGKADGKNASLRVIVFLANAQAASVATYQRGAAPALPAGQPATAAPNPPARRSNRAAFVFAAIVAAIGAGIAGWLLVLWNRRRRLHLEQLKVVEPNIRQAAAQPLDPHYRLPATAGANGSLAAQDAGTGRLRAMDGAGEIYPLGAGPAIIGTSPRACTIVLPPSDQIAPEHLRIWLRDGRYLLHHVGGMSRKTYIGGQAADWVTLEPGDELTVGPHRLIFEDPG